MATQTKCDSILIMRLRDCGLLLPLWASILRSARPLKSSRTLMLRRIFTRTHRYMHFDQYATLELLMCLVVPDSKPWQCIHVTSHHLAQQGFLLHFLTGSCLNKFWSCFSSTAWMFRLITRVQIEKHGVKCHVCFFMISWDCWVAAWHGIAQFLLKPAVGCFATNCQSYGAGKLMEELQKVSWMNLQP